MSRESSGLTFLFSRDGRISRGQYWQALLIFFGASLAAAVIGYAMTRLPGVQIDADGTIRAGGAVSAGYLVLGLAYSVAMTWAGVCVTAKRCHDRGRSAWFMLVQVVPLLNLWFFVEVAFRRGTPGANPYGPDPLDTIPALAPRAVSA